MTGEHRIVLSIGMQVVTRVEVRSPDGERVHPRGAVGAVVALPDEADGRYRIRFPDGEEAALTRSELAIRKHVQRIDLDRQQAVLDGPNLLAFVIYRCVVGSRAFVLDEPGSDVDRRGIYLPPAGLHWSIFGVPEVLENEAPRECYWELQKFLTLALKGKTRT